MIEKLAPQALATAINAAPVGNTGDGIRAALWIGASLDPPNHQMMIFDRALIEAGGEKLGSPWKKGHYFWMGSQPFLRVNLNGERFVNEDLPYDFGWHAALMQPGKVWWMVWDDNYAEDIPRFRTAGCSRIVASPGAPPTAGIRVVVEAVNHYVEKDLIQKADTIESLALKMKVPLNTFKATVEKYNEMAKQGKDTEFGKVSFRLSTLEKAPFYAGLMAGCILCNLNGLRINTKLQVLDVDLKPISGLYAAGNDSGSFFAHTYPSLQSGISLGRAATFGRLAGINAAEETV
jgi:succinate dehydrogenase/fumarate reductase flavoprotein subunit